MVLIAGDFNQFRVEEYLEEHTDLHEVIAGPTRGDRRIDRLFCNFKESEAGVVAALQPEEGTGGSDSDHKVVFASTILPSRKKRTWDSFLTRKYTEKRAQDFKQWITGVDWTDVYSGQSINEKVDAYQ